MAAAAAAVVPSTAAQLQASARHAIGRHLCHFFLCEPRPTDVANFVSFIEPEVDIEYIEQRAKAQHMLVGDIHVSIAYGLAIIHEGKAQFGVTLNRDTIQHAINVSRSGAGARTLLHDRLHKFRNTPVSLSTDRAMHFYNIHLSATGLGRVEPEHMAEVWLGCMMAWQAGRPQPLSPLEQSTPDLMEAVNAYQLRLRPAQCQAALAAAVVQRLIVVVVSTRNHQEFQLFDTAYKVPANTNLSDLVDNFIFNENIPLTASLEHHFDSK